MIIVKVELHSARTGKVTELGRAHISNTGTGDLKRADYEVEVFRKGSTTKVQRRGLVMNYPRQAYTVWELVKRGLEAALGKKGIHPGTPEEFDEAIMDDSYNIKPQTALHDKYVIVSETITEYMNRVQEAHKELTRLSEDGYGKQYAKLSEHDRKAVDEFSTLLKTGHVGSSFDGFLEEQGIKEEVERKMQEAIERTKNGSDNSAAIQIETPNKEQPG